jgi:hypothetical protein
MISTDKATEFGTALAVIISSFLQQWNSWRATAKRKEIKEKIDEVHVLTNDRMSKMMTEVEDLKQRLAHNEISGMDERLKRIEASSIAAEAAATKTATIIGSK